jgi:hypothetical protein
VRSVPKSPLQIDVAQDMTALLFYHPVVILYCFLKTNIIYDSAFLFLRFQICFSSQRRAGSCSSSSELFKYLKSSWDLVVLLYCDICGLPANITIWFPKHRSCSNNIYIMNIFHHLEDYTIRKKKIRNAYLKSVLKNIC